MIPAALWDSLFWLTVAVVGILALVDLFNPWRK